MQSVNGKSHELTKCLRRLGAARPFAKSKVLVEFTLSDICMIFIVRMVFRLQNGYKFMVKILAHTTLTFSPEIVSELLSK